MPKRAVILDCDPGIDDAINILLAISAVKELDILGITTVAGNVPVKLAAANACFIRDLAGRPELPVFAGCDQPLRKPLYTAESIHGESGIGPVKRSESAHPPTDIDAVDFIEQSLTAAEDKSVTLVLTGPMTNIATLINRHPNVVAKIAEIVLMGGALREAGNCTPSAEFNMYVDPHAADIVFSCGAPIVVHGLDVTHQVGLNVERFARLGQITGEVMSVVLEMLEFFQSTDYIRHQHFGVPLHDPCTIMYLLEPNLFSGTLCNLRVETESKLTMGHTAVDFWLVTDRNPNVNWIHHVDADGFYDLLISQLARL